MNKISLVIAVVALLASSNVPAAGELKIGFIKTDRVFREAAPAVRALNPQPGDRLEPVQFTLGTTF